MFLCPYRAYRAYRRMKLVWCCVVAGVFRWAYLRYKKEPQFYYLRTMLGLGLCVSRGTAAVLNICCPAVVLPMCRALCTRLRGVRTLPRPLTAPASDSAKTTHLIIAATIGIASVVHTASHMANAYNFSRHFSHRYPALNMLRSPGQNPLWMMLSSVPGITGVLMLLILVTIFTTSLRCTRMRNYDAFWYTHHLSLIFLLLLAVHPLSGILKEQANIESHVPGCTLHHLHLLQQQEHKGNGTAGVADDDVEGFPEPLEDWMFLSEEAGFPEPEPGYGFPEPSPKGYGSEKEDMGGREILKCSQPPIFVSIHSKTWAWVSAAAVVYAIDLTLRWLRRRPPVQVLALTSYPCDVLEVKIRQENFQCKPGQYVLVQCPKISRLEWHPFTITSYPAGDPHTFTLHMRAKGDWSGRVASFLSSRHLSLPPHVSHPLQPSHNLPHHHHHMLHSHQWDDDKSSHINFHQHQLSSHISSSLPNPSLTHTQSPLVVQDIHHPAITCQQHSIVYINEREDRCSFRKKEGASSGCGKREREMRCHGRNDAKNSLPTASECAAMMEASTKYIAHLSINPNARLHVDGPFSSPSQDMGHYPVVIAAAGGIGITPLAATLYHLLYTKRTSSASSAPNQADKISGAAHPQNDFPQRVHAIWVVRDAGMFLCQAHLLTALLHALWRAKEEDRLELRLHVTRPVAQQTVKSMFGQEFACLIPRIYSGRPEWKALFREWITTYSSTRVGVFTCGPRRMCRQVERLTLGGALQGWAVSYHQESFL
ncbi:NADPH oxidase 4-like isoform X2 [Oratosquilla oratoria]|uniref:NADPH oxidase 4-like isoform X2 n=1 Tax=Oratosquilla oratoria TaxID=337810 RepID=UPI003F761A15